MSSEVIERQAELSNSVAWPVMAFSEAVEINPKRPLPKIGNVPFLEMAALPLYGAPVEVVDKRPVASGGARFKAGDTLFARITPCAENGKLGFVTTVANGETAQGSTEFIVMGARDNLTLPEYVRWLSCWSFVRNQAIGLMEGTSGRQRIPAWAFDEIEVPIPPLAEQRRIAEVLRSVDEAIAAQTGLCSRLRQMADDLADELFGHEISNCEDSLIAYGDACETVQVGIVIRPASYYVEDGGVPALRSTNIKRNEIDFSALVQLSQEGHQINRKSSLRAGDVVTIRTGEPGKTAVVPNHAPSPLNCIDIIFSRPKPKLRSYFAAYFINSGTARRQIKAMQGGLAQQHFNVGEMKKLKLPVPDLAKQDRVVAVLDAAWHMVSTEEAQLATLKSTKVAIMSDLLSGRVRVPA